MKKQYIIPVAEIIEIEANQTLMAGSMKVFSGGTLDSKDILSREDDWGWDEEEE